MASERISRKLVDVISCWGQLEQICYGVVDGNKVFVRQT